MITSESGEKKEPQKDILPTNQDIERILAVKAYIRMAWQLSQEPTNQELQDNVSGLGEKTQEALQALVEVFKSDDFKKERQKNTKNPLAQDFILAQDTTSQSVSQEQQAFDLLKKHPSVKRQLFFEKKDSGSIIEAFEASQKKFSRYSGVSNTITAVFGLLEQSAYNKYNIFPPVFLPIIFMVGVGMLAAPIMKYWEGKEDLDFAHRKAAKKKSVPRIILAVCAFLTFILAFAVGGPAVVGSISAFMALYGFVKGSMNFFSGFKSILQLWKERKRLAGETEEAYRYRRIKKTAQCFKYFSDAVFCMGVSIVWGLTFAAVANPIGLKVVSVLSMAAVVATACVGVSQVVEMYTSHKLKQAIDGFGVLDRLHITLHKHTDTFEDTLSGLTASKVKPSIQVDQASALLLLRDAQSKLKTILMRASEKMGHQRYRKQHEIATRQLDRFRKKGSVYDDISYEVISEPALPELLIKIPHEKNKAPGVHGPDYQAKDTITRHCEGEVLSMRLNADASDRALYLFFQLHRGFGPLKMAPCRDPKLALKVMEAAKLMNVEVILDPEDRKLFRDPKHENLNEQLQDLEAISTKVFQKMFQEKTKTSEPGEGLSLGRIVEQTRSFWPPGTH